MCNYPCLVQCFPVVWYYVIPFWPCHKLFHVHVETSSGVKSTLSHFQHHCIHKMHHWSKNTRQDSNLTNDSNDSTVVVFSPSLYGGNGLLFVEWEARHTSHIRWQCATQMASMCVPTLSVLGVFWSIVINVACYVSSRKYVHKGIYN